MKIRVNIPDLVRRWREVALIGILLFASGSLIAQTDTSAPSPPPDDDPPTFMKLLSDRGLHDIVNESWNAYAQFTYISSWKPSFSAAYTNLNGTPNSLLPTAERSFTGTATIYLGVKLWKGAEFYLVPELISELPLSNLKGLGAAIQNSELQKGGAEIPQIYRSRAYLKQTFGLGGHKIVKESGQQQLGTTYDSRRFVFVAGNFSVLDFFDKNAFDLDPRDGFLGMAFMTYAAYDFAADARGYAWGGIAEFYWDDWAARFGRLTPPKNPNQLPIDFRLAKFYGDQLELEHKHKIHDKEGTVRLLAYRNREDIGRFSDAIAAFEADPAKNATTCPGFTYGSDNPNAPDLCWARKPNVKIGVGMFAEQSIGHDVGVFSRAMVSDGKTEVDSYTSTDRSASFGLVARGSSWSRRRDIAGAGFNLGWISKEHAEYLAMGGIDGFIGDGAIKAAAESTLDLFYSVNVFKSFWFTGDFQHVTNPAFNADRGPVNIFAFRLHGEF